MKIAIVEDNQNDLQMLLSFLEEYKLLDASPLMFDLYNSGEEFLKHMKKNQYHAVFMDIYMDQVDGVEAAKQMQNFYPDVPVVFLTTSEEDIWRAVKTHSCFDYIQKKIYQENDCFRC